MVSKTPNAHFGILLDPKTVLDIEDLKKEETKDQFGFEEKIDYFIDYVNEYLGNIKSIRKSIVVGIYGDYGSGKSIFVNLVKNKVEIKKSELFSEVYSQKIKRIFCNIFCKCVRKTGKQNSNTLSNFITFHTWKYKDEQSIWRNFILYTTKKMGASKKKLDDLYVSMYYSEEKKEHSSLVFVNILIYLVLLISIVILDPTGFIAQIVPLIGLGFVILGYNLLKRTKSPMFSIEEFENKFHTSINNCEHDKIYIAIENIDRCLPHQSIRLLESLKAFLENNDDNQLEKDIIFLIPCDKNILQLAIEKEYGNRNELNASTYLDKLIQLPYDLPVCSDRNWKGYVESLINAQHVNVPLSFKNSKIDDPETKSFSEWIIKMLNFAQIRNPREVKLLFREWEMRFINLPGELKTDKEKNLTSALFLLKLLILKKKYHEVYIIYLNITSNAENIIYNPDDFNKLNEILFTCESANALNDGLDYVCGIDGSEIKIQLEKSLSIINESTKHQEKEKTMKLINVIEPGLRFITDYNIRPSSFEDLKKFMLTTKSAKESKSKDTPKGGVPS